MKPSPIFGFIEKCLSSQEKKEMKLDLTVDAKKYFYLSLPVSTSAALQLDEKEGHQAYDIIEQHLSIYEYCDDRYDYFTAYHLTLALHPQGGGVPMVIHCYFDEQGTFKHLTAKIDDEAIALNVRSCGLLRDYAELQSLPIISQLNVKIDEQREKLLQTIQQKECNIVEKSKNLDQNINSYIKLVSAVISLLEEFNSLDRQSLRGKQVIFEKILAFCQRKQQEQQSQAFKQEGKEAAETEATETPIEVKSDQACIASSRLELVAITEEIKAVKANDSKLLVLLKRKLDLLNTDDFDEIIKTLAQLNALEKNLNASLLDRAINGDKVAVNIVVKNLVMSQKFILNDIVLKNNFYFFKAAYQHKPFPLNDVFVKKRNTDQVVEGTYLKIAYERRNREFFIFLLENGANPNISFSDGFRLIHNVAGKGEIFYAEQLQKYNADLSSLSGVGEIQFNKNKRKTLLYCANGKKAKVQDIQSATTNAKQQQKSLTEYMATRSLTPLMWAIYNRQIKMVVWLLKQGVDLRVRGFNGTLNAITLATYSGEFDTQEERPPSPEIIRALLQTGECDIDEKQESEIIDTTSLYAACSRGHLTSVKLLVTCFSANPNVATVYKKGETITTVTTPLVAAIINEHLQVVKFLLNQDTFPLKELALEQALDFIEKNPGTYDASPIKVAQLKGQLLQKAHQAFTSKDYQAAISLSEQALALQIQQGNRDLYKVNAMAYAALGRHEQARQSGEKYIELLKYRIKKNWHPGLDAVLAKKLAIAQQYQQDIIRQCQPSRPTRGTSQSRIRP